MSLRRQFSIIVKKVHVFPYDKKVIAEQMNNDKIALYSLHLCQLSGFYKIRFLFDVVCCHKLIDNIRSKKYWKTFH